MANEIIVKGANENNLKHIDVRIQLKVIGQIYGIVKCGVNLFF